MSAYSTEVLADTPYLYYRLGNASGSFTDSSGSARTATVTGSPTYSVTGAIAGDADKAVTFSGSSQYGSWTTTASYTGSWTVEFWVKFASFSAYPGVAGAWAANSAGNYGLGLDVNTGGNMDVNMPVAAFNGWRINTNTGTAFTTGVWYHVVVTNDATAKVVKVYKNAVQVGSDITYTTDSGLWNASKGFRIASSGGGNAGLLNGTLDEVAVYQSALSASRISTHYSVGVGNHTESPTIAGTISVAGLAPTITGDAQEAPDIPDISIAGLAPTVTAEQWITLSAPVADIAVAGLAPTVATTQNPTIAADVVDVSVAGLGPSVASGATTDIGAGVADIAVAGQDANVIIDATVPILIAADLYVEGVDAAVIIPIDIPAPATANVQVAGVTVVVDIKNVQFLRPAFTTNKSPFVGGSSQDIDDVIPNDDVDYVYWDGSSGSDFLGRPTSGGGSIEIGLTHPPDGTPYGKSGHVMWVRYKTINNCRCSVTLWQGSRFDHVGPDIDILNGSISFPSSATWTTASYELTVDQAKRITDYNNLYPGLGLYIPPSGGSGGGSITQFYMEVPAYDPGGVWIDAAPPGQTIVGGFTDIDVDNGVRTVAVGPPSANITVEGNPLAWFSTGRDSYNITDVRNIQVAAPAVNIDAGGVISIGVDVVDVLVDGRLASLTTDRTIHYMADVVDVAIQSADPTVRTGPDSLYFKFIASDYVGMSSRDALPLNILDFGPLLHGQTKILRFRLGNESVVPTQFILGVTGTNPVEDMVTFSPDGVSFTPTAVIGYVPANGVTDVIWMKMTVDVNAFVSEGSFLVEVVQAVV